MFTIEATIRKEFFFNRQNYLFFLRKMRKELSGVCDFLSRCLMPNHFHWLIYVPEPYGDEQSHQLSSAIGSLLRSYTRAIQKQEDFRGSLFQQKTKSKLILSLSDMQISDARESFHDDLITVFNYIHQNPWKAGLSGRLEDWEFSSFRDFMGLRPGTLCNQKLALDLLGIDSPKELYKLSYEMIMEKKIERILSIDR